MKVGHIKPQSLQKAVLAAAFFEKLAGGFAVIEEDENSEINIQNRLFKDVNKRCFKPACTDFAEFAETRINSYNRRFCGVKHRMDYVNNERTQKGDKNGYITVCFNCAVCYQELTEG